MAEEMNSTTNQCPNYETTMDAIRVSEFGAPDVLKVAQTAVPGIEENEVLVRVFAAGVNPVETYIRAGAYARKPCK